MDVQACIVHREAASIAKFDVVHRSHHISFLIFLSVFFSFFFFIPMLVSFHSTRGSRPIENFVQLGLYQLQHRDPYNDNSFYDFPYCIFRVPYNLLAYVSR